MRLTILSVGYPLAAVSSETAGGAEQILATLDEAFVKAGHRSLVIAPEGSQVRGLLLPTHALSGELDEEAKQNARSQHRDAIERALSRFSVDVIHMHGIDYFHYLPEDGPPVAVTLHLPLGWYSSEALAPRRSGTRLICVSKSQCRDAPANAQIDGVIENGVRLEDRVRSGSRKAGYVLAMGRVCPEKAFHVAMDAARDAGYPLWLAGTVYRYPSHQEYFEKMIAPRLRDGHRLLGPVGGERKVELIRGARCVLVASQVAETSSLVAMEALSCGVPVIAFMVGALPEIVDHGRTGFLIESQAEMIRALSRVGAIRPEYCRAAASQRFSAERMVRQYLELYDEMVSDQVPVNGKSENCPALAA